MVLPGFNTELERLKTTWPPKDLQSIEKIHDGRARTYFGNWPICGKVKSPRCQVREEILTWYAPRDLNPEPTD